MNAKVKKIEASEILDSRGNPTISVTVVVDEGVQGTFDVPSGASTGAHEALELRDGDPAHFEGKGVLKAVKNVTDIIQPVLLDLDIVDQYSIDKRLIELDGTLNKSKLGANAMLGVSIACAKAAAMMKNVPTYMHLRDLWTVAPSRAVPFLYMNLINGGLHARSRLAFQEYLLVPQTEDVEEALEIGTGVMRELRKLIEAKFGPSGANIGDEGGFAPDTEDIQLPLELLFQAAKNTGHDGKIKLALDVAASSFYKDGKYFVGGKELLANELSAVYGEIISKYPMLSIEDPFAEESFADFALLREFFDKLSVAGAANASEGAARFNNGKVLVIGDDLTTTNKERLAKAISKKAISGVIIKPNQIGTLTETVEAMKAAREAGLECIVSHRSGETSDDFIADLAYAYGAFGLKAGAPQREERVVKYNRLLRIVKK